MAFSKKTKKEKNKEETIKEEIVKEKEYLKCRCGKIFGKDGVSMRRNPSGDGYLCTECVINKILR